MPIASTTIKRGPAFIRHRGYVLYTQSDIKIQTGFETFDVATSIHGKIAKRPSNRFMRVTCTPAGMWNANQIAMLFPYGSKLIGESIYEGGTGGVLDIVPLSGDGLSLPRAAVTKMPPVVFSAVKTLLGEVEFTAVLEDGSGWGSPIENLYAAIAAGTDTSFSRAQIITQPYLGAWGTDAPFNSFETKDGFNLSFTPDIQADSIDSVGTLDHIFQGLEASITCMPAGLDTMEILAAMLLQDDATQRGADLAGHDLVITGNGVVATLTDCMLTTSDMAYGSLTPRQGGVAFNARRTFTGGVMQPLYTLGLA